MRDDAACCSGSAREHRHGGRAGSARLGVRRRRAVRQPGHDGLAPAVPPHQRHHGEVTQRHANRTRPRRERSPRRSPRRRDRRSVRTAHRPDIASVRASGPGSSLRSSPPATATTACAATTSISPSFQSARRRSPSSHSTRPDAVSPRRARRSSICSRELRGRWRRMPANEARASRSSAGSGSACSLPG